MKAGGRKVFFFLFLMSTDAGTLGDKIGKDMSEDRGGQFNLKNRATIPFEEKNCRHCILWADVEIKFCLVQEFDVYQWFLWLRCRCGLCQLRGTWGARDWETRLFKCRGDPERAYYQQFSFKCKKEREKMCWVRSLSDGRFRWLKERAPAVCLRPITGISNTCRINQRHRINADFLTPSNLLPCLPLNHFTNP